MGSGGTMAAGAAAATGAEGEGGWVSGSGGTPGMGSGISLGSGSGTPSAEGAATAMGVGVEGSAYGRGVGVEVGVGSGRPGSVGRGHRSWSDPVWVKAPPTDRSGPGLGAGGSGVGTLGAPEATRRARAGSPSETAPRPRPSCSIPPLSGCAVVMSVRGCADGSGDDHRGHTGRDRRRRHALRHRRHGLEPDLLQPPEERELHGERDRVRSATTAWEARCSGTPGRSPGRTVRRRSRRARVERPTRPSASCRTAPRSWCRTRRPRRRSARRVRWSRLRVRSDIPCRRTVRGARRSRPPTGRAIRGWARRSSRPRPDGPSSGAIRARPARPAC